MKFGVPWTVKGVRPEARATAREAAQRSGMSVGDWLNSAILGQAEDDFDAYDRREYDSRDRELALIYHRLDQLADRLQNALLKKSAYAPARDGADGHRTGELIELLERRLEQFSNVSDVTRPEPQKIAPSIVPSPAFDRASDLIAPPTQPSPDRDLSGVEEQLRQIIDQLETLHNPSVETINALRSELERMVRALNESLPKQVIGVIESQIQKLYDCITDNRQAESNGAALVRIESCLADLQSALREQKPASLKQVEDDIASLREMITHVASDESIKNLAIQARDISSKIDQIQHLYAAHVAEGIPVRTPSQPHTTLSQANESSARFIAAARRNARASSRETDADVSLINTNARIDEDIKTFSRPRKLMRGLKFLFMAASIVVIVIGSMELMDHVMFTNIAARVLGSVMTPAASDMAIDTAVKQDASDIEPGVEQPNSTPSDKPRNTTDAIPLEEKRNEPHAAPNAIAPSFLPTSANLFDTTTLPHASDLIQGAPSLFDSPISTAASTPESNVVGSAAPASNTQASVNATPPVEELPPAIAGERLRKAAMAGDPAAAYTVAQRYAEGHGVPINLEEAARWYKRAASKGLVPAQFRYATMLEKGQGVTKNLEQARQFYIAAAAKGDAKSMHNLAVLLAQNINGKPDYANAVLWFRKAANHGIADSQFNLAVLTARGLGAEENLVEAYKWFALAAAQGDREAGNKRDEIAAELDPQQLTAARESVKAFTVKPQPKQALVVPAPAGGWDEGSEKRPAQSTPSTNRPLVLGAFRIDSTE